MKGMFSKPPNLPHAECGLLVGMLAKLFFEESLFLSVHSYDVSQAKPAWPNFCTWLIKGHVLLGLFLSSLWAWLVNNIQILQCLLTAKLAFCNVYGDSPARLVLLFLLIVLTHSSSDTKNCKSSFQRAL